MEYHLIASSVIGGIEVRSGRVEFAKSLLNGNFGGLAPLLTKFDSKWFGVELLERFTRITSKSCLVAAKEEKSRRKRRAGQVALVCSSRLDEFTVF